MLKWALVLSVTLNVLLALCAGFFIGQLAAIHRGRVDKGKGAVR